MQFAYRAKNQDGKLVKGAIESKDNTSAIASLQQKGLYVIEAREENAGSSFDLFKSKIALKDKIIFTKQLSLMIRSGLSIIDALRSLSDDSTNKMFSKIINSLIREVEGGLPLSQALDKHKDVFGTIYINMVKAGEKSGKVDVILERLAIQLEKDYELNRKVRGALSYPIFILVTMVVVVSLIVVIVIPQLKTIFDDAGVSLPVLTRAMIWISFFLQKFGLYILVALILAIIGLARFKKTISGKRVVDGIITKIPVASALLKKSYMARFTRTFASLSASGLPLLEIFESSGKVVGNVHYEDEISKMSKQVENGESLSKVFKKSKFFPSMVGQLVLVGEKSGKIDEVFDSLADFFEREVDDITGNLGTMLEPILMVVIGIGIGLVVISVLQPIYSLVNAI